MNENISVKNKISSCVFTFPMRITGLVAGNFKIFRELPINLTSKLIVPIIYNSVLDETLDTAQIVLTDMRQNDYSSIDVTTAFEPGIRVAITFEDGNGKKQNTPIHMMIAHDDCKLQRKDNTPWKSYKHTIQLVELTKELERLSVDTLTFTNPIPRAYDAQAESSWSINQELNID